MQSKYYYTEMKSNIILRFTATLMLMAACISHTFAQTYVSADGTQTFTPSAAQKGVQTATDAVLIGMPVATLTGVLIARDWEGLKQGALTAATTAGATLLLKYTVKEERPNFKNLHSFPSGHTSLTFANAAFLQRRYGWKYGAPAFALATFTGWGRVYAKNHHWWDVLAGAALGAGSAYIFTTPYAQKHELSIAPYANQTSQGIYFSMKF